MINFLWQMLELFGNPQLSEILFVISLFILPHLLSFLLGLFYKKFRFKMLWLGLWIVLFCALVCGYVFLVYRLRDEAFDSLFSLAMSLAMMLSYIFSFYCMWIFWSGFRYEKNLASVLCSPCRDSPTLYFLALRLVLHRSSLWGNLR